MLKSKYTIERGIINFTVFATVKFMDGMPTYTIVGVGLPEDMPKSGGLFVPFKEARNVSIKTQSGPGPLSFWKCQASFDSTLAKYIITNVWMKDAKNPSPKSLPPTVLFVHATANDTFQKHFNWRIRPNLELIEKHKAYMDGEASDRAYRQKLQAGAVEYHISKGGVSMKDALALVMGSAAKPKPAKKKKAYKSPRKGFTSKANKRNKQRKSINNPFACLRREEVTHG